MHGISISLVHQVGEDLGAAVDHANLGAVRVEAGKPLGTIESVLAELRSNRIDQSGGDGEVVVLRNGLAVAADAEVQGCAALIGDFALGGGDAAALADKDRIDRSGGDVGEAGLAVLAEDAAEA